MQKRTKAEEDSIVEKFLHSEEPWIKACVAIIHGAHLIEPYEPEMAREAKQRFYNFGDSLHGIVKRRDKIQMRSQLTELRNALVVIAAITEHHKITVEYPVCCSTDDLVHGYLDRIKTLEEWGGRFGVKSIAIGNAQ
jgi:hypothetical protein